jgi:hypothetical protein
MMQQNERPKDDVVACSYACVRKRKTCKFLICIPSPNPNPNTPNSMASPITVQASVLLIKTRLPKEKDREKKNINHTKDDEEIQSLIPRKGGMKNPNLKSRNGVVFGGREEG